jgi:peroxiredoxin
VTRFARWQDGASFSGRETNRVYLNRASKDFIDATGVSGLDHDGDGRSLARLDFDRDGWTDIAVINANTPMFQLFRNRMGEHQGVTNRVIAVRFEGAAREGDEGLSTRDGYGAKVEVVLGDKILLREHRAGEGLAAQNSNTRLIGLGDHEQADVVRVTWPSGRTHELADVPAGTLVTAHEVTQSDNQSAFTMSPYVIPTSPPAFDKPEVSHTTFRLRTSALETRSARLTLYVTTATWCASCLAELKELEQLRGVFTPEELQIIGVPYDDREDDRVFRPWIEAHHPVYSVLTSLDTPQRALTRSMLEEALGSAGLPASILTDQTGRVRLTTWGAPTVSSVRRALHELSSR